MKNSPEQPILVDRVRPRARKDGLVIEELDGETLIYDTKRDKAHCLNSAAAQIWRHCNGRHTLADMRDDFAGDMPIELAREVVSDCVVRLSRAHLIEEDSLAFKRDLVLSRRNLLRKIGIGAASAIVVPVITSIIAPTPAAAASCGSFSCGSHFNCPFSYPNFCVCNRGRCVPFF